VVIMSLGYLNSEEIDLFHKQGYVLKSQCIDAVDILKAETEVTSGLLQCSSFLSSFPAPSDKEKEQFANINGSRIVFRNLAGDESSPITIVRVNGVLGLMPSLETVLRSEKLLHTFFELLGTDELEHIICQLHPKLPGDNVSYPRHRDIQFRQSFDPGWTDILGNGSYAICIIPIDNMTKENGGLWIETTSFPFQKENADNENIAWITARPGDVLFMHPHLYHGSGPNESAFSRRTLLSGFCAFGANRKTYPGAFVNVRASRRTANNFVGNHHGGAAADNHVVAKGSIIEFSDAPWRNHVVLSDDINSSSDNRNVSHVLPSQSVPFNYAFSEAYH
jgi:hypothetical protein